MTTKLRGWVLAGASVVLCVATWAAVVRADTGVARALGVHLEELRAPVSSQMLLACLRIQDPSLRP